MNVMSHEGLLEAIIEGPVIEETMIENDHIYVMWISTEKCGMYQLFSAEEEDKRHEEWRASANPSSD